MGGTTRAPFCPKPKRAVRHALVGAINRRIDKRSWGPLSSERANVTRDALKLNFDSRIDITESILTPQADPAS